MAQVRSLGLLRQGLNQSEVARRLREHYLTSQQRACGLMQIAVFLKHLLKWSASEYSPAQVLKPLAELYSVDIVLPTVEGRERWLRRITKLDDEQQRILHQLQLQLP